MENYVKGKNVEEPLERDNVCIPDLPSDFLWMHVRGGSKIRNLVSHALKKFKEDSNASFVWTGFGPSLGKAVTCAEIFKKESRKNFHQVNKICYRKVQEYWDPIMTEMDQLIVERKIPMIHILLSPCKSTSGRCSECVKKVQIPKS